MASLTVVPDGCPCPTIEWFRLWQQAGDFTHPDLKGVTLGTLDMVIRDVHRAYHSEPDGEIREWIEEIRMLTAGDNDETSIDFGREFIHKRVQLNTSAKARQWDDATVATQWREMVTSWLANTKTPPTAQAALNEERARRSADNQAKKELSTDYWYADQNGIIRLITIPNTDENAGDLEGWLQENASDGLNGLTGYGKFYHILDKRNYLVEDKY